MLSHFFISSILAGSIAPVYGAVHEKWNSAPKGWVLVGQANSGTTMTLSIALTMQNTDQLESKLLSVSTPSSPNYGKYLDVEDVNALFSPSSATVSNVVGWLKQNGVSNYTVDGAFVDFTTTVETANTLLNASYQYYTGEGGAIKLRTLQYSIPDHVQKDVTLVFPATYFGKIEAMRSNPVPYSAERGVSAEVPTKRSVDASCQGPDGITPACLKALYNVGNYTPSVSSGSKVGFSSFLGQSALYSDLALYEQRFGIPSQNFSVELIAGGINDQNLSTARSSEANMDVQIIIGVSHPLPVTHYITGGLPPFVPNIEQPNATYNNNEPYVPYYRYLLSKKNSELPQVISHSYGDIEDSVPYSYAVLTCTLIGIMGIRGITILHSTGDIGVGAGCLAPDYKTVEFNPMFPGTCPFLTSVGGTTNLTPEIAWAGSSGGFSKYFPQPSYQRSAISKYLTGVSSSTKDYYGQYTDFSGRGIPDVAAQSFQPAYFTYLRGQIYSNYGTSAAVQVWGALVGMLNDARFKAGKPALGFLNPLLYSEGGVAALNDITGGYSIGCNGNNTQTNRPEPEGSGLVPGARWNATVGWDPVTGHGTPDFSKLKDLVLGK